MSDYTLELEEACNTLKKHCAMMEACKECIFYHNDAPNMNNCRIMDTPEIWPVNKIFNRDEDNGNV